MANHGRMVFNNRAYEHRSPGKAVSHGGSAMRYFLILCLLVSAGGVGAQTKVEYESEQSNGHSNSLPASGEVASPRSGAVGRKAKADGDS